MRDEDGKPTRLALSAHAWGEPVPKTKKDAKKLAAKGTRLLERYAATKTGGPSKTKKTKAGRTKKPKTSLVENINKRKRAGTSRSKARSTISKEAYEQMEKGWPKSSARSKRRTTKRARPAKRRTSKSRGA
jgi:hypothetical protein